jgi:hypothetical protein
MADSGKKPSNYDDVIEGKVRKKANAAYEDASQIGPKYRGASAPEKAFVPAYGGDAEYERKRRNKLAEQAQQAREMGREEGIKRQKTASERGGVLGTPMAYVERAGQFLGDKFDDADAAVSNVLGMDERATFKKGMRQGLKDEGYAKGGSASSRADGCAQRGKTKGMVVGMNKGGMSC